MAKTIKYKISDIEALKEAFPEVVTEEQVVRNVVDKHKLYQLVKTYHKIDRQIPGIEYASTSEPAAD